MGFMYLDTLESIPNIFCLIHSFFFHMELSGVSPYFYVEKKVYNILQPDLTFWNLFTNCLN